MKSAWVIGTKINTSNYNKQELKGEFAAWNLIFKNIRQNQLTK